MGLFDTIIVEKALPLPKKAKEAFKGKDWGKVDFQTKDLEECMQTYYLKKNGDLILEKIEGTYEELSETEIKENKKNKRWFAPTYRFIETARSLVKQKITQTINFYTGLEDNNGNEWWLEFVAVFNNGKLSSLKSYRVELTRTAEEIKKADDEFKAKIEADFNLPWNKTKRVLNSISYGYWSSTWKLVAKTTRKAGQGIDKAGFWIYRYM
jgi:superfamily I DNA and/or RNA helicase